MNTFESLSPIYKEVYSGKKKELFKDLRKKLKKGKKKKN
jgi:hypothetical protein